MKLLKCKMCGGDLEVQEHLKVTSCSYCGTRQTLPNLDDDERRNLYGRANHFRRNNEFDKAKSIYEQILNEDKEDAEAYWSIILCKFGIEYVEDPKTHKMIPTCNRTQFTSIFADEDYKEAISHADPVQRELYEQEAKNIDLIQKEILDISAKEEPFDIFICYKETDDSGKRTQDSVLAQELYYELIECGYKVFFSRITLENKIGSAYEPYIFAALNNARIMIVIGTKAEYFNAIWVKNEWGRYLALISKENKKKLIPAYRDMNPYDLPIEFSHLQSLDMEKLGFVQDLLRGIEKILVPKDEVKSGLEDKNFENYSNEITGLIKRVFLFIEDGDWEPGETYCERVLDFNPKCAEAYLGKLLVQFKLNQSSNLIHLKEPFDQCNEYKKILRFGSKELIKKISSYNQCIIDRKEEERQEKLRIKEEEQRKKQEYLATIKPILDTANDHDYFTILDAIVKLKSLKLERNDISEELKGLKERYEALHEAEIKRTEHKINDYDNAVQTLDEVNNSIHEIKAKTLEADEKSKESQSKRKLLDDELEHLKKMNIVINLLGYALPFVIGVFLMAYCIIVEPKTAPMIVSGVMFIIGFGNIKIPYDYGKTFSEYWYDYSGKVEKVYNRMSGIQEYNKEVAKYQKELEQLLVISERYSKECDKCDKAVKTAMQKRNENEDRIKKYKLEE